MNPKDDDNEIRRLLQRVKAADQREIPSFDEVLLRPIPETLERRAPRRVIAVLVAAAALLLMALWLGRSWTPGSEEAGLTGTETELQPTGLPTDAPPGSIDFDRLHAVVDEQFTEFSIPEWQTPSDELLALGPRSYQIEMEL